jgi:1,2-diacylglycerol 3-beta-galactosyltransferase
MHKKRCVENPDPQKRILILTADAGFGHRSAANAIKEALEETYPGKVIADVVNPLDEPTAPDFLHNSQSDYDRWVRHVPELYQLGYEASDRPVPTAIMERSLVVLLEETMRILLDKYRPDVIVTTYPAYQAPMLAALRIKRCRKPFYTVITDLSTLHRLWFYPRVTGCMVPNSLVADLALNHGINEAKIFITGIPVSPKISRESRSKAKIRQDLGWQEDLPTILAVGSKRVDRLMDTLNVINHFGAKIQLAVVAGKDEDLYKALSQVEWHIPVYLYDFVENIPSMMKATDLLVCKAGGLIVTEALACALPLMLIEVIPGQETGNAEYATAYGTADIAQTPVEVLETLDHLMRNDQALLKKRSKNAQQIGKPRSAFDTADLLWKAAQGEMTPVKPRRKSAHPENPDVTKPDHA